MVLSAGRPCCASASVNWEEEEEADRMGEEERVSDMWMRPLIFPLCGQNSEHQLK